MRIIKTEIEIKASLEVVWKILMDFENYPSWNPFITNISGIPQVGQKLAVMICPPGQKGMKFSPKVAELSSQSQFSWKGQFLFPGLFDGEHSFSLQSQKAKTIFLHQEAFSGLLPHILPQSFFDKTQTGFQMMNQALKKRAEAQ
ncbi:SRPBCC domain-containing protein [Candidatus Bealeia paramacronuclearis]|uniref:SRPBCC domain-containing protein n=1 Tax=Candidatus Bealeia paramacronuclearis TaxID=1921001 RepID=A0ABZ2C3U3_9PROT|nr:SRPBCC domain-containing protein [Candidatus Bealeia paramacronuclearis]